MVQRSGANPRAVGHASRGWNLRGSSMEWCAMVRGRGGPKSSSPLLLWHIVRHPALAHGLGGEQEVGGLFKPGLTVRGVGHTMVQDRGEFCQCHRGPGVPRWQVL
uniref:Uncharacterized protein n=1 Tax=Opuntia streptacantha TaxID=393608 RepID=A0A7C9DZV0_OPUST